MEKHIKDFENYTVNNSGNNDKTIFNTITRKYKKPQQYKSGYLFVSLYQNGVNKIFLLHRLIAQAFIPNPQNKPCIDHINGDRTDNRVENLRWCSYKENMNNPITRKRISESRIGITFSSTHKKHIREAHNKQAIPIAQHDKMTGELVAVWPSSREVEREIGYMHNNINYCCNGKYKQAYGSVWYKLSKEQYETLKMGAISS